MKKGKSRNKQTVKCLKWISKYGGWWYIICTPNEKHMDPKMMRLLIKSLYKAKLYELIFVLLMVHRNEPFVEDFIKRSFLDMMIAGWSSDKEDIIQKFMGHLQ